MSRSIKIDPLTRIEGHLAFRVEVENQHVVSAFCSGEMFRGFEQILKGRHPLDAQQITQRICGICPISHGLASVMAQEQAYQVVPPENGRLARNLLLAANYVMSHLTHFYHLSILDFVDITALRQYDGHDPQLNDLKSWVQAQLASSSIYPVAPFLPRYEGQYIEDTSINIAAIKHYAEALDMRAICHKMAALFGGKLPHSPALVPGGITETITIDKIARYASLLKQVRTFIEQAYVPDVLAVSQAFPEYWNLGKGTGHCLSYGVFPESEDSTDMLFSSGVLLDGEVRPLDEQGIAEDLLYSRYSSLSGLHPTKGDTIPDPRKSEAYSWLKAPRYKGNVMEVGPVARVLVAYHQGERQDMHSVLETLLRQSQRSVNDLLSVMGRHVARAVECKLLTDRCVEWIEQVIPGEPTFTDFSIPANGHGAGLTEAPRGALGHWIDIQDGMIGNYQCVVPTTWNCSPRDDQGKPGAIEQSLVGTPVADEEHPIEVARVVRSFDPCIACAVH